MKPARLSVLLTAVLIVALLQGCAQYVVTQQLAAPLKKEQSCLIGAVTENLPADMDPEDKPPFKDIDKFREYLQEALAKKDIFGSTSPDSNKADYEVTANLLTYKRGNGVARFFIGFGVGDAKITVELKLRNRATGELVFAGNFKQTVSDGLESGIEMYRRVANDFASELSKQQKKLLKG